MKSCWSGRVRRKLRFRLSLQEELRKRTARREPKRFRDLLTLEEGSGVCLRDEIQDWQEADYEALDLSWKCLAGLVRGGGFQRAYVERPRGHSKTTDMAVQLAWILQNSGRRVEGVAAAADRDQAGLIRRAVERIAKLNPEYCADLEFRQYAVVNSRTGSRLSVLSSDARSSWGLLPDFVICDELSHWEKPDLWYSLVSSAAKKKQSVLAVLTNAGVGCGWQWEVREQARRSDQWYFSSLDGCRAPWIDRKWLEDQRGLLPESVYARLWENRWQQSRGGFVSEEEVARCRDESLVERERGECGVRYVAAVDYAEKHDYTVGVVIHWAGERLVVDRMDVVVPGAGRPVPVKWVEEWLERVQRDFGCVRFVVDEYQLLSTIQRYETEMEMERFAFGGGKGNHQLAVVLRQMIVEGRVAWYAGCGSVDGEAGDDLEAELKSVHLQQASGGRCRIDHVNDGVSHDDRVFALGVAVLAACEEERGGEWMEIGG
ncbi:MAG: hypothetical protein KDA78_18455, partial [Planctomycetaceae bacterium]|nr:hypothetical protein [Planctomycetaceae bacterium]